MKCPGLVAEKTETMTAAMLEKTQKHPCYSFDAHQKFARMHLPVAPYCNISCNYCNRKFDCVNESRPGVTSEILTPQAAKDKFIRVKEQIGQLSVVGIAGPGDALADWENTRETIRLISESDPQMVFCLSTNGLLLPEYAQEIIDLGVTHVTVTVNCLDSAIGAKIYKHINYKGHHYEGEDGVKILIENQLAGIALLTVQGIVVKVNIVMLNGINDHHIPEVVKKVKELGVYITNIMPLIPASGSVFENFPQTAMKDVNEMRNLCELDVMQMRHCKQCRADAIGLLGEDRSQEFRDNQLQVETLPNTKQEEQLKKIKVAVTSKQGKLVNLHFGHAKEFLIYEIAGTETSFLETRSADQYCLGNEECDEEESRRDKLIDVIADCDALLTMRIGYHAEKKLLERDIVSVEYCYTVEQGLKFVQQQLM